MGIFDWLDRQFASDTATPPRPAEHEPVPPQPVEKPQYKGRGGVAEPKTISEPVISLLGALKRDEWERGEDHTYGMGKYSILTNVWYEHIYLIASHPSRYDKEYSMVNSDWMTPDEQKLVAIAVVERAECLKDITTQAKHKMKRDRFMVFVDKGN